MLAPEESDELRSLQARAYGRDSALTAADAERLRELEDRRVVPVVESGSAERIAAGPPVEDAESAAKPAGADGAADEIDAASAGVPEGEASTEVEDAASSASSSWRSILSALRPRWRSIALAAVVVLTVGVGIGWLAFGRSGAAAVELSAEQQGWQNDLLADGVYDPGSIRALAIEEGAVIWTATKGGQERTCLILGAGGAMVPTCERTERVASTGIYGSISVKGGGNLQREVSAQMLFTASGEPAVAVSTYEYDPTESGVTYANEKEAETAARLSENGFDASSLWVVGYDRDVPIWAGQQTESHTQCLIYDGSTDEAPVTCADPETMQDQASNLVLTVVDTETGGTTSLEMMSGSGPGYLVITREGDTTGAGGD